MSRGALVPRFPKFVLCRGNPLTRTSETKGHWQHYDPGAAFRLEFLIPKSQKPVQEFQTGGTGNRVKTNRCEAVKLEITANGPVPDTRSDHQFSSDFALVSHWHRDKFARGTAKPSPIARAPQLPSSPRSMQGSQETADWACGAVSPGAPCLTRSRPAPKTADKINGRSACSRICFRLRAGSRW